MTETVSIPAIPAPLYWLNEPETWKVEGTDALEVRAGGGTDLFTDMLDHPDACASRPPTAVWFCGSRSGGRSRGVLATGAGSPAKVVPRDRVRDRLAAGRQTWLPRAKG